MRPGLGRDLAADYGRAGEGDDVGLLDDGLAAMRKALELWPAYAWTHAQIGKALGDAGRKVDALELAQRCRKLSPSFVPPAAFTAELAQYARELGRHRLADDLDELAAARAPSSQSASS